MKTWQRMFFSVLALFAVFLGDWGIRIARNEEMPIPILSGLSDKASAVLGTCFHLRIGLQVSGFVIMCSGLYVILLIVAEYLTSRSVLREKSP